MCRAQERPRSQQPQGIAADQRLFFTRNFGLEKALESADREATEREVDLEAILVSQLRELVAAVAARLPFP
jgi:hypothetical protein